jgi:hypothetical protein
MRLLNTKSLMVEEFPEKDVSKFAILSHTWQPKEITIQHIQSDKAAELTRFEKIQKSCSFAEHNEYSHIWIDTCCIDKSISAEFIRSAQLDVSMVHGIVIVFRESGRGPFRVWEAGRAMLP